MVNCQIGLPNGHAVDRDFCCVPREGERITIHNAEGAAFDDCCEQYRGEFVVETVQHHTNKNAPNKSFVHITVSCLEK